MIDSHALVGSCAQVGKNCHISAAAQIGGVLEPVGALPVIIEDDVLVGGNCGVYEGTVVKRRAVLGSGDDPDALDAGVRYRARRSVHGHGRRAADDSGGRRGGGRLARHHARPRQGLGHFAVHAGDREVSRQQDRRPRAARRPAALRSTGVRPVALLPKLPCDANRFDSGRLRNYGTPF